MLGSGNAFARTPARLTRPDLLPAGGTRTLDILDIGRHLVDDDLDPPLRALVVYNHNPLVVHPDQNRLRRGLSREEVFTVGIEIAMTESMAYCDVVLPSACAYECDDLYAAYGHQWLQRARPVVAPPGQAVPNTEVFRSPTGQNLGALTSADDRADPARGACYNDTAVEVRASHAGEA